jgi:hypothetical protein
MRWYEEFQQPTLSTSSSSKVSKVLSLFGPDSGPTQNEKERARVLEISREKMRSDDVYSCRRSCGDDGCYKSSSRR